MTVVSRLVGLQAMIIFTLIGHQPLAYKGYHFPGWCDIVGWLLALSSVGMIPGMAIYQIATTPGSLYQVGVKTYLQWATRSH